MAPGPGRPRTAPEVRVARRKAGAEFRQKREAAGLRQRDIAEVAGVSTACIAAWEKGRGALPDGAEELLRMAVDLAEVRRQERLQARIAEAEQRARVAAEEVERLRGER